MPAVSNLRKKLSAKLVNHVLAGSWGKIDDLEGWSSTEAISYLNDYLSFITLSLSGAYKEPLINSLKTDSAQKIINAITQILDINNDINDAASGSHTDAEVEIRFFNINKKIASSVKNLSSDDDTYIIPGGWDGISACATAQRPKYNGHAMYYFIKKDPENFGKFIFGVINSGDGLVYHTIDQFRFNEKPESILSYSANESEKYHMFREEYSKTHPKYISSSDVYSFYIECCGLTEEQVTNHGMLTKLIEAQIKPLRYNDRPFDLNVPVPYYGSYSIYRILQEHGLQPKKTYLQPVGNYVWQAMLTVRKLLGIIFSGHGLQSKSISLNDVKNFIQPQRIGNCAWKALMMVVRKLLGMEEYKKFIHDLKINTLNLLCDNLETDPRQYGKYHLLIIQELRYGVRKAAKSLYRHKQIFQESFELRLEKINSLLSRSTKIYENYLTDHHGQLTDQNLSDKLSELKVIASPSGVFPIKDIDELLKDRLVSSSSIKADPILIPVSYIKNDGDPYPSTSSFLDNLKKCLLYADNHIKSSHDMLRAFITHNVFYPLPLPKPGQLTFWDTFDNFDHIKECLEALHKLSELYLLHMKDNPNAILLSEHKYNLVKVFIISKFLIKKYSKSTVDFKEIIKDDLFCLSTDFEQPLLFQDGVGLDPHATKLWYLLREQQNFTFRQSIYEKELHSALMTKTTYANIKEDRLYLEPEVSFYAKLLNFDADTSQNDKLYLILNYMRWNDASGLVQTTEQINLANLGKIVLMGNKRCAWVSKSNMFPYLLEGDIYHHTKKITDEKYTFFSNAKDSNIKPISLRENLFYHNRLPEPYFSSLKGYYDGLFSKDLADIQKKSQNQLLLAAHGDQIKYETDLIANPSLDVNGLMAKPVQIALLLDYIESLDEEKQYDPVFLQFFKQVTLVKIGDLIEQLQYYPILKNRWITFFKDKLNKTAKKLDAYKDDLSSLKHVNKYIYFYLCLQRIIHKTYCFLREEHLHKTTSSSTDNLCDTLQNILVTSRTHLLSWITELSDINIDKGQIASYGLASFGHLQGQENWLNDDNLKQAIIFSTYIGMYGFGKDCEQHDLLLKKDIYDTRLKIANQMQKTLDVDLKNKLLNYFLHATKLSHTITQPWEQDGSSYVVTDIDGNIIKIDIFSGTIAENENEIVYQMPQYVYSSYEYKNLFGERIVNTFKKADVFVTDEPNLPCFEIKLTSSRNVEIYWSSLKGSEKITYRLLNISSVWKIQGYFNGSLQMAVGNFSFWGQLDSDGCLNKILVTSNGCTPESQHCFAILADGKVVKASEQSKALYLGFIEFNKNNIVDCFMKLGCKPEDILFWKDEKDNVIKIELPVVDADGNWLSFEREESTDGSGKINWCWNKDHNYRISAEQTLKGWPSLSNFILLENQDGEQQAIFVLTKQIDLYSSAKNNSINPTNPTHSCLSICKQQLCEYIPIAINQHLELPQAQLLEDVSGFDVKLNLYIAYLNLICLEGEPLNALKLGYKQHKLAAFSLKELEILWWIANYQRKDMDVKLEELRPDAVCAKYMSCSLIKHNLKCYPRSKEEIACCELSNKELFDSLFKPQTTVLHDLNKSLLESLSKIPNPDPWISFVFGEKSSPDSELLSSFSSDSLQELFAQYLVGEAETKNISESIVTTRENLLHQENEIVHTVMDYVLPITDDNSKQLLSSLKLRRIFEQSYNLTIDDIIDLYLAQKKELWKAYTGIQDINVILDTQRKIIKYLLLKTKFQHLQYLHSLPCTERSLTTDRRTYDPILHPEFLVYEVRANIRLRQEQIDGLTRLLNNDGDQTLPNQCLNIIMGMGKTKVLNILLSYATSNRKCLSMLVLTDPLYASVSLDTQKYFRLLGRKVRQIEYSRQTSSVKTLANIEGAICDSIEDKTTCVTTIRCIQTLNAMPDVLLETIFQNHKQLGCSFIDPRNNQLWHQIEILVNINDTMQNKAAFTLDELDYELYLRRELNLPVGQETTISSAGIEAVAELFSLLLKNKQFSETLPIRDWLLTNNQSLLSQNDFEQQVKPKLVEMLFENNQNDLLKFFHNMTHRDLQTRFMAYFEIDSSLTNPENSELSQSDHLKENANLFFENLKDLYNSTNPFDRTLAEKIVAHKMQLVHGKLQEALSKSANVNFGRSRLQQGLEIIILYDTSNPKESSISEYSLCKDPWETVNKTLLYYISSKWRDHQQTERFKEFLLDNCRSNDLISITLRNKLFTTIEKIVDISVEEITNRIEKLRQDGDLDFFTVIFKYLQQQVFPEQLKFYITQVNSTVYDVAGLPKVLNGYSGTRRGESTWHSRLKKDDSDSHLQAINNKLIRDSNRCICYPNSITPENLFNNLSPLLNVNLEKYSSFIDAGALFKGFRNKEVAKLLLQNLPPTKQAVAFYHEIRPGVIKLALIRRIDLINPVITPTLVEGSSPEQIAKILGCPTSCLYEQLFNFYDQSHVIGSDLPNPPNCRAIMTFSEQVDKDLMAQAVMRMRKFLINSSEEEGQSIDFLVPEGIKTVIFSNLITNKKIDSRPKTLAIIHLIQHATLVQDNQERQDYYNSFLQKLNYTIKNYFQTKIRRLLNKQHDSQTDANITDDSDDDTKNNTNINNKEQNKKRAEALALYGHVREFLLTTTQGDIFSKYAEPGKQENPTLVLQNHVQLLCSRLNNLKLILTKRFKTSFNNKELEDLQQKLREMVVINNCMQTQLPVTVPIKGSSEGEIEISVEQQQEQQSYAHLEASVNRKILGKPLLMDYKINKSMLFFYNWFFYYWQRNWQPHINYLLAINFGSQYGITSLTTLVQKKIAKLENLNCAEDLRLWRTYQNFVSEDIYYSEDALQTYQQILPEDGLFTQYQKPISQVLIIEEPDSLKLLVVSVQECTNFTNTFKYAREEQNNGKGSRITDRKIWLISLNGEALDGTDVAWVNPFQDSFITRNEKCAVLLLQMLVLNKNVECLNDLLINKKNLFVNNWIFNNEDNIKKILGHSMHKLETALEQNKGMLFTYSTQKEKFIDHKVNSSVTHDHRGVLRASIS